MDVLIIFLLILLNSFFALSEIAVVSSKTVRLEILREEKKKGANYALKLKKDAENFLSSIQVGITLVSLITGFYGGVSFASYFSPLFLWMGLSAAASYRLAVVLSIVVITYFSIVIGELVPKSIALSNPEKHACRISPIVFFISKLFFPIVKLLSSSTKLVKHIFGINDPSSQITEDELKLMIKDASKTGVIEEEQNFIHEKLFYFSDKRAKHIMTHRSEVEWIDMNLPDEEFTRKLLSFKSSKILVCDKYIDNYQGVLSVKEFLIQKYENRPFKLSDLLYAPIVFPESIDAQDVLDEFKKQQFYFCVVLDEFGTFEGIITLHDIVENIVGEIPEEEEIVEPDIFVRDDRSVLVNGDAPIEVLLDVIEGLELDFEEIDYSTVAGFVLEHIEKNPEVGDTFDFKGYHIEIVDIDHNRIDKILIKKIDSGVL